MTFKFTFGQDVKIISTGEKGKIVHPMKDKWVVDINGMWKEYSESEIQTL